jgi:hypothetical protein
MLVDEHHEFKFHWIHTDLINRREIELRRKWKFTRYSRDKPTSVNLFAIITVLLTVETNMFEDFGHTLFFGGMSRKNRNFVIRDIFYTECGISTVRKKPVPKVSSILIFLFFFSD